MAVPSLSSSSLRKGRKGNSNGIMSTAHKNLPLFIFFLGTLFGVALVNIPTLNSVRKQFTHGTISNLPSSLSDVTVMRSDWSLGKGSKHNEYRILNEVVVEAEVVDDGVAVEKSVEDAEGGGEAEKTAEEVEEEEDKEEGEDDEEEEEITKVAVSTSIVCITTLLIFITILFEEAEEHIHEHSSKNMKPIIESLFGEMTILGFLSAITFVITQFGAFQWLSLKLYGEDEFLVETFELVHFTIFFIMVFFVIQVLMLAADAGSTEEEWMEMERACSEESIIKELERRGKLTRASSVRRRNAVEALKDTFLPLIQKTESQILGEFRIFHGLRKEFILERSTEPPFAPMPKDKRLPDDFNFGRYLSTCMGLNLGKAVNLSIQTWSSIIVFAVVFYLIGWLVDFNIVALSCVWVAFCWLLLYVKLRFAHYLLHVRDAFAGIEVNLGQLGLRESAYTRNNETTYLLQDNKDIDKSAIPDWAKVDMDHAIERESTSVRQSALTLAGFKSNRKPNRQSALFAFGLHGPKFHGLFMQLNLIYIGIYCSLLVMIFIEGMYKNVPLIAFIIWLVLAMLPIAAIMKSKKKVVALMSTVNYIGTLRSPQVIARVIREQKTSSAVRALIVFYKLNKAVENPETKKDKKDVQKACDMCNAELLEVGKTFDAFDRSGDGSISHEEFADVMKSLVKTIADDKINKMIELLDSDGNGDISKEEFLAWYTARMMEEDETSEEQEAHHLFKLFDEDGSGEITIGEFKNLLDAFNLGFTLEEIGDIVHELDENHDGTIGFEEFEDLIRKYQPKELSEFHTKHMKMQKSLSLDRLTSVV